ncbi:hypothetical protein D3C81_553090 [compost metagenome]
MRPLPVHQCRHRLAALLVHPHIRHTVVHAHQQHVAAFAARIDGLVRTELFRLDPGREGHCAAGGNGQRRRTRQVQRRTTKLHAAADDGAIGRLELAAQSIHVCGGITRLGSAVSKVIDRAVVRVEHALAIACSRCTRVAVIHPQRLRGGTADRRHVDPYQRHAKVRVVLLDLVIEHGVAIGANEAQVLALGSNAVEGEVAGMQADQHGGAAKISAQRSAVRTGVHGDRLAVLPVGLPPGGFGMRDVEHGHAQAEQQQGNEALH